MPSKTKKKRTFKKNDFINGDGMLTAVWGPSLWHYLHTLSFNYPVSPTQEDKKYYRQQITLLQYTLPCKYCRINLKNNFKKFPLKDEIFENRDKFSRYIYNLHELINKMLGKKSNLTFEMVRERYEHFRARCAKLKKTKKTKKNKKCKINKSEIGCTEPLIGKKAKCILKIVPQEKKCDTFQINKQCIKKRVN